jgi:metallophosphoesterase superfamily enzyme
MKFSVFLLLHFAALVFCSGAGTTFFIVGDYGVVTNITQAEEVFDAMNIAIGESAPNTIGSPEFIITVGDNIYPASKYDPTVAEFQLMLSLFNRTNIADLPVWAVRGNHDAYFNWTYEILLTMQQS